MSKVQAASTQDHVPIAGVRNGIIILKDGSLRLVLNVAPINFSLKSEQEQNSIIFKYQSFLNALHFPIQISIQSKKLDLTPYLQKMRKLVQTQTNELIQIQTEDYVEFVSELINVANIMSKSFYVSISHIPLSLPKVSFVDKLLGKTMQNQVVRISEGDFKSYSEELLQKGNQIASNLGSIGLRVRQLTTQEILEMYYNLYNPEEAGKERLIKVEDLQSEVVIDKREAEDAVKVIGDDADHPKIDNQATVAEAERRQSQMPPEQSAQVPGAPANTASGQTQTVPQPTAIIKPTEPEVPPIKARIEAANKPEAQPAPPPAPAIPGQLAEEPTSQLENDNYTVK